MSEPTRPEPTVPQAEPPIEDPADTAKKKHDTLHPNHHGDNVIKPAETGVPHLDPGAVSF